MKHGKYSFGDIVIAEVYFTDLSDVKKRPALVLFQEYDNIIVAGITNNRQMKGISKKNIYKKVFSLSNQKKKIVKNEFCRMIK